MTAFTSNWFVFFPLAFSLFVAIRLAEGSVDRRQTQLGQLTVRGLIGVLFLFAVLAVGLRASPLGLAWIGLLAVSAAVIAVKNRRLKRSAWLMTALHTRELNEQTFVCDAFLTENRGWVRRTGLAVRRDLANGLAWWNSIENRGVAKGVYEKLAVRLIARYGLQGSTASQDIEASPTTDPMQIEAQMERLLARLMLFSWVGIVTPLVLAVVVFVFPTLTEMFDEFGLQLPPMMLFLTGVADSATGFGWASVMFLAPIAWLLFIGLAILLWLFPQLMQLPLLNWLGRDYYRNVGFVALARTVEQEPSLVEACRVTGQLVCLPGIRSQYIQAADLMSGGMQARAAFLQAGLISRSELSAFGIGFDDRDPAWSLQQLAHWKTARMLYRYGILVQIGVVVLTLCLAAIVGCIAVGVFQVLSMMIWSLA